MWQRTPSSTPAKVATRDFLSHLEPRETLLDAGFATHPTGPAALMVTKTRVLWRLIGPAASPVRTVAFAAVWSIVAGDGPSIRMNYRPGGPSGERHEVYFEFHPDDSGVCQTVMDRATVALFGRNHAGLSLVSASTQATRSG